MKRQHFLKNASMVLTGAGVSAAIPKVFGQGRDLRPIPPVEPPATKTIIDVHVHDFFQDEKPADPKFAPLLNNSRPDATYQMNAGWEQFQYDLEAVHKACLLHVAQDDVGKKGNGRIAEIVKRWP